MAEKNKEGKKDTVKVDGKSYTLQHPGVKWYINMTDRCRDNNGNLVQSDYIEELLDFVVIQDVTWDDFEYNLGALRELIDEIESFLGANRM